MCVTLTDNTTWLHTGTRVRIKKKKKKNVVPTTAAAGYQVLTWYLPGTKFSTHASRCARARRTCASRGMVALERIERVLQHLCAALRSSNRHAISSADAAAEQRVDGVDKELLAHHLDALERDGVTVSSQLYE
eukprot:SAG11_NODE_101_length_16738_cov_8.254703_10_plen_133_part_00